MIIKGQTGSHCTYGEYQLERLIISETNKNGGVTVNRHYQQPISGYVVSIRDFNKLTDMMQYKLGANEYYGAWVDEGIVYYGISIVVSNKIAAMQYAKMYKQKAIYDLKNNESIFV